MTQRGRAPTSAPASTLDAMTQQLDSALADSIGEIQRSGSDVTPESVVRGPDGRFQSTRREPERRTPRTDRRQRPPEDEAAQEDDGEDLTIQTLVDENQDDADRNRPAREQQRRRSRDVEPDEDEEDEEDDEDDYDEDDVEVEELSDESEEDDHLATEGEDDDDEEDEDDRPRTRRGRRSGARRSFSEREIERRVEAKIGTILEERDRLREQENARRNADSEMVTFLSSVLGTPEKRAELEAVALDRTKPQAVRDHAADTLRRYKSNMVVFEKYKAGAWAAIQAYQVQEDQKILARFSKLKALDPKIVAEGNRAKTLLHAYVTGMTAASERYEKEIRRLKRQLETRSGQRSERRVRNGITRRPTTAASGSGRRSTGNARPDRVRGILSNQRGIEANSLAPMPTDDVLKALKNGDITFRDIGLAQ